MFSVWWVNDTLCKVVKAVAFVLCFIVVHNFTSLVTVLYTECGTERKEPFEICAKFKRFSPFCADTYWGSRTQPTLLCTTLHGSLVHLNAYILIVQHIITKINIYKCVQCTPVHLRKVNDTSMTSPLHEGNLCNAVQKLYYFYWLFSRGSSCH